MRALSMQKEPTYLKNHYSHFHCCHFKHYSTNHEIDLCILSHSVLKHSDPLKAGRNLKNDPPELFQLTGGEAGATAGRWPLQEPHLVADSPRLRSRACSLDPRRATLTEENTKTHWAEGLALGHTISFGAKPGLPQPSL